MSKIQTAFKCILCEEELKFPNDLDITGFLILQLQFYKDHEVCDQKDQAKTAPKKRGRKKK